MRFKRRAKDGLNDIGKVYLECKEIIPGINKSLIYVYPTEGMQIGFYMIAEFDEKEYVWISQEENFFNGIEPQDEIAFNSQF